MIAVTRIYRFSASHRLHLDSLSSEQNAELYGKCNNPFGHGHNYRLEVSVVGPIHQVTGQMIPLGQLDALVQDHILTSFDHRNLNADVPQMADLVPTTENVLAVITGLLKQHWSDYIPAAARLYRVHIQETDRNGFRIDVPADASSGAPYTGVEV